MASKMLRLHACLFLLLLSINGFICSSSSKVYVVYMGSKGNNVDPDEIFRQNHLILTHIHNGSAEEAQASHVYTYKHGFRGFAAKLTEDQAKEMATMPEVVSVFPNEKRRIHTTHSWDFMGLNKEEAMEIPPYSTENQVDVIIGFIDTGIWPESASFNDEDMPPVPAGWRGQCQNGEAFNASSCNRKIIGARYYMSGFEAEEDKETTSFRSPRDSSGHGTHTASTAAGRLVNNMNYNGLATGGARGGAPMARIAVYKTCWDSGCYDVDLLAAIDDAIRDGVHVLSLSLGPDAPQGDYFGDAISIGSFHAVSRGITVVASVGNAGFLGSATNLAPWMITVGASSMDRDFVAGIELENGYKFTGESLSSFEMKEFKKIISASEANAGYFTPYQSSFCLESSLNSTKAKGKILVCQHSGSSSESKLAKSKEVKKAGGIGMILVDDVNKEVAIPFVIPAATVGKNIGDKILAYVNNNTRFARARILSAKTVFGSKLAPRIASFSSKGPNSLTPEILKPDITAPGLNILAAWSPANGKMNSNILSGTSMACPHVTGIVALIKAVHPSWSPSAIKSAIMTTARVRDKYREPITVDPEGRKANAFDYGAGFTNPTKVLSPGLIYDAQASDYISFLCSIGYDQRKLHLITRDNSSCDSYPSLSSSATNLNQPSITVPNLRGNISINRTVKNIGDPKSVYRAVVYPPEGINVTVFPKRLAFSRYGQKMNFSVYFNVEEPIEGYRFGFLTWRNRQTRVTVPLVVRASNSGSGLLR
ncbi:subtilisin-like serine-protease S [Impatiens glandulifera]|uniref:subtilisin-like serine-protease S n=1 Tax=Impatiens glandulifera TaxID=253017 RepID=UPI001FB18709|nr:subtilisin-like serine-protease S [Impatiens glandulifera]